MPLSPYFGAVIFDLDGTLVDSAPDLTRALNRLLDELKRPALDLEAVVGMIGDGATKLVERAMTATGGLGPGDDLGSLTGRFLNLYEGATAVDTRPYPGVCEALANLSAQGCRLGVCTNKPEAPARAVLEDVGLAGFFGAVLGGDSLGEIRKPDPRHLLAVLDRLGIGAGRAVMVGDNANDVAAARAAGLPVILRAGGYTRVPAADLGADLVIEDFAALPAALTTLGASPPAKLR